MSTSNQPHDDNDFTTSPPISTHESKRTYLLTYSRADMTRFPDCDAFLKCVLEAFDSGKSTAKIIQWAACPKNHSDNKHKHYHMAVKLSGTRRWYGVFKYLKEKHNIVVNFSSAHCGYVTAYRYICKDKPMQDVLHRRTMRILRKLAPRAQRMQ